MILVVDVADWVAVDTFPAAVDKSDVIAIDAADFVAVLVNAILFAALLDYPTFVGADPRTDVWIETQFLSIAAINIP